MKVFIVGSGEESDSEKVSEDSLRIGDGVRFGLARNPKNNRVFVFNLEKGELPEKDVKLIRGKLHRNPKGFGFVEDAYVAPNIIESVASEIVDVTVLAVYGKHPTKDERSWRVIKLTPT